MKRRYYFDSGSFTKLNKKAYKAINEVLKKQVSGEISNHLSKHKNGRLANDYLIKSREVISKILEVKNENILFTSGASESNLIAFRSVIYRKFVEGVSFNDMNIIIATDEHPSVYKSINYFEKTHGIKYIITTPDKICEKINDETIMVSANYINSINGIVREISKLSLKVKQINPNIIFHTDSAQATGYKKLSPQNLNVDLVTIDSAKTFGPQGVGALLFSDIKKYKGLEGKHDILDIRPGTQNVANIYGFSVALKETQNNKNRILEKFEQKRNYLLKLLKKEFPESVINGVNKKTKDIRTKDLQKIAPNILNVSFVNANHNYLITLLDVNGFSVSGTSACSDDDSSGVRISFSPKATKYSIKKLIKCIKEKLPLTMYN